MGRKKKKKKVKTSPKVEYKRRWFSRNWDDKEDLEGRKNGKQEEIRERKKGEKNKRQEKIDRAKAKQKEEDDILKSKLRKANAKHDYTKSPEKRAYEAYQKTDWWKERRHSIKEQFGYNCEICNSNKRIAVHHNNYRLKYEETNDDLIVLCHDCHSCFHSKSGVSDWPVDPMYYNRCCLCAREAHICVEGEERLKFCRLCLSIFLKEERLPEEYNYNRRFELARRQREAAHAAIIKKAV